VGDLAVAVQALAKVAQQLVKRTAVDEPGIDDHMVALPL